VRRELDLAVGEAQGRVAGGGEERVALAVAFEGGPAAVPAPGVGLHDDALRDEDEVDRHAAQRLVDERLGESVAFAEGEERLLEVAPRAGAARLVLVERAPQPRRPAVPRVGPGDGIEGG
jgi:hypothetical protein